MIEIGDTETEWCVVMDLVGDILEREHKDRTSFRLTCCLSAAMVVWGKTFTVTQQEDEESSTTTAKLLDTQTQS